MQTHSHFLFVYGSLLSGFKSPAYEYIFKYFKLKGEACVHGTIYNLGEYPVGTSHQTGRLIKGELYEIRNAKELSFVLAQLDDYEGLYPDDGEEVHYKRELVEANLDGSESVVAWVYWFTGDISDKPIIESDNMLDYFSNK